MHNLIKCEVWEASNLNIGNRSEIIVTVYAKGRLRFLLLAISLHNLVAIFIQTSVESFCFFIFQTILR